MTRKVLLLVSLLLSLPRVGAAILCGDDVGGQDVPCSCGDVVVSDLRLDGDPVLSESCASDGLLVDARSVERALTIDLQGKTLRGRGRGAGILVLYGGPGGASVVSSNGPASIEGFEDGLVGRGNDVIALVEDLRVRGSGRDGVRVHGNGYEIRGTQVHDAGRDGFSVNGAGYRLQNTLAINSGRYGYFIMGNDGRLGAPGNEVAALNGTKAGFTAMGSGHRLVDCRAIGNLADGLRLMGTRYEVARCTANENRGDGISGTGSGWSVIGNQARNNGNDGIAIRGQGMVDGGHNVGSGNRGERTEQPVQCEVGGVACIE